MNRLQEEASLRHRLDNVNKAMASFVSNYFSNAECGFVYQLKDNISDPISDEEIAIVVYERHTEQAEMEAKARYVDWVNEKDEKSAFSFRKAVLRRDRPD